MLRLLRNKKGQSTGEYAILIGVIVAAAIAMQTYVKRGIQARLRDESHAFTGGISDTTTWQEWTTGNISTPNVNISHQYEPEYIDSKSTQDILADTENYTFETGGTTKRESTRRTKQETGDYQKQEYTIKDEGVK